MKRLLILAVLLTACDVGNSSSDSESNQVFNPEPITCNTECSINAETGEVTGITSCTGSEPFGVPVTNLDVCDSIFEAGGDIELPEEDSGQEE